MVVCNLEDVTPQSVSGRHEDNGLYIFYYRKAHTCSTILAE